MNLWNKIRRAFGGKPALRNKAGGMAWIRGIDELNGRIVTTVRPYADGFWEIDPPQDYVATQSHRNIDGRIAYPGQAVRTIGLADSCLEPIRDTGITSEEVSFLFSPKPEKEAA